MGNALWKLWYSACTSFVSCCRKVLSQVQENEPFFKDVLWSRRDKKKQVNTLDDCDSDNEVMFIGAISAENKDWGFHHVTSSPGYPQSNGQSKTTVQTVKSMLEKADDPYKALLSYQNTPLENVNLSPSQMLMGRCLRTQVPMTREMLRPQLYEPEEVLPKLKERQRKQQLQHDKTAKELPPLRNGEFVRVQEATSGSLLKLQRFFCHLDPSRLKQSGESTEEIVAIC